MSLVRALDGAVLRVADEIILWSWNSLGVRKVAIIRGLGCALVSLIVVDNVLDGEFSFWKSLGLGLITIVLLAVMAYEEWYGSQPARVQNVLILERRASVFGLALRLTTTVGNLFFIVEHVLSSDWIHVIRLVTGIVLLVLWYALVPEGKRRRREKRLPDAIPEAT